MSRLAHITNPHALVRLVAPSVPRSSRADWSESAICVRAQSILTPTPRGGACPPLTLDQAKDVLAWYCPKP